MSRDFNNLFIYINYEPCTYMYDNDDDDDEETTLVLVLLFLLDQKVYRTEVQLWQDS